MPTFAEVKARLLQMNQRSSTKANDIWKAKDEHDVRLLPDAAGGDPFAQVGVHYNVGARGVVCREKMLGETCEFCDFARALAAFKDQNGKEKKKVDKDADWKIFCDIQVKEEALVRMVERNKDGSLSADGPKWMRVNRTNMLKLMEACSNVKRLNALGLSAEGEGDLRVLFDPHKAFDIHVSFKGASGETNAKGNTKTSPITDYDLDITASALSKDKKEIERVLAAVKPISEVYPVPSAVEVSIAFRKYTGAGAAEAKPEGGTEKYAGDVAKSTEKVPTGGKTVEQAFEELLNS